MFKRTLDRLYSCAAVFFAFCILMPLAPSLAAQTAGTGALRGTVTDSTGAVVPNATVTVSSVDTGQVRTATTGADGVYTITLLPPGPYHVKFEASGFQTTEIPSITVTVTETSQLDRSLQVGTQTQEVTVQGEVETIQTASSALGTVANSETITQLPLNTRNYTNLLAMSAGANGPVTNASSIGKGASLIAVNGSGNAQNTYLQDGVPINNWFSFNTGVEGVVFGSFPIPNPDSIAEFKIQTSSYDAGYGRNPGANVNVITKSGTNTFHGSGFEFFRNSVLNANDWFLKRSELRLGLPSKNPAINTNTYGGTFGGPVKKDKIFFFVSYQENSQKNGLSGYGSSSTTLPPIPTGNRGTCPTGGFSDPTTCDVTGQAFIRALAINMSPNTGCPNFNQSFAKVSTAGSINVACPLSALTGSNAVTGPTTLYNINPVAISILQLKFANGNYALPSPGGTTPVPTTFVDPAIFKDHMGIGNLDYQINAANTLSVRYEYEKDPISAPFPVNNANTVGQYLPGFPVTTDKADQSAVLRLTSIITPNLVNEAHIAYQRYVVFNTSFSPFSNPQVGIKPLSPQTPQGDLLSTFTLTGIFTFGLQNQFPGFWPDNQFQWADQISWNHGKHTFRTGFEAVWIQLLQDDAGNALGAPTFQSFGDFLIGRCANVAGCALSNGATSSSINSVGTFAQLNAQFPLYFRGLGLDGFVQDDIKLSSKLTVNLGVRWEYDGWPTVKGGLFSDVWPSLVNTVPLPPTQAQGGTLAGFMVPANYCCTLPAGVYKNSNNSATPTGAPRNDFAPRIGFAWQPTGSNRWVLRGGFGMFYDLLPGTSLSNSVMGVSAPAIVPAQNGGLTTANLSNPWQLPTLLIPGPPGTAGFTPRFLSPGAPVTGVGASSSNLAQATLPPNLTTPVTYEWNLNTQYEFLPSWVVELGYVGSHGIHQAAQGATAQGQASTIPINLAQIAGTGAPCPSCALTGVTQNSVANAVDRVPNLGFSANQVQFASLASYKFNSLQATVRKQMSHGLQLQAAYTWSRAFITQGYGINTYPYFLLAYGLNPNYRPQRLVVNYVWNIPFGHHDGMMGKVTQGWSLAGVTTRQDGSALTITNSGAGSIFCGGSCSAFTPQGQYMLGMGPANVLAGGTLTQRVINGQLNAQGVATGTAGYFNAGVFAAAPSAATVGIPLVPGQAATGFGNVGLGTVLGPGQNNWDMSLSKTTPVLREGQTVEFRAEFFNIWNHPQFANPTLTSNIASFGQISNTSVSPRIIQLALKYSF